MGLWSGVGLVVANMVGVGVLSSTGFMAMNLTPAEILLCWMVGAVMALAGARAYAAVAEIIPRSGGEYRYLSDLMHPAVGYLVGWTSLLVGFSAPVAVAAATAGPFAQTIFPWLDARWFGAAVIAAMTAAHAFDLSLSRAAQNTLIIGKVVLLLAFIVLGLTRGETAWPDWQPAHPSEGFPLAAFATSSFFVAFAYSGWNSTVYAAEEFRDARRNVPRAMLIGAALVSVAYLAINYVFVANLTPDRLQHWVEKGDHSRVTLGHLLTQSLLGDAAGRVMSAVIVLSLISSVSVMTYLGPRIYAAMARDGFLPRIFAGRADKPPLFSVLLQGVTAIAFLFLHRFAELIGNIGLLLTLASALTAICLFRVQFGRTGHAKPGAIPLLCAAVFAGLSGFMFYFGLRANLTSLYWLAGCAVLSMIAYLITRVVRGPSPGRGPSPR